MSRTVTARHRLVQGVRSFAWRVLGDPPGAPIAPAVPDGAGRARTAPKGGGKPWAPLRPHGLRVEPGLKLFGAGNGSVRVQFEPPAQLNNTTMHMYRGIKIGRYSFLRSGTIRFLDEIGRYTSIGPGVIIGEGEHPVEWLTTSSTTYDRRRWFFYPPDADNANRLITRTAKNSNPATRKNTVIGNDVWIGANAMIRRGVTVGDGAVIAAGAFVNRDVEPYTIVGGLPAKPIRKRFDDETVAALLDLKWWEFDISDLGGVDFTDVHAAIADIRAREKAKKIRRVPVQYDSVKIGTRGFGDLQIHPANAARAEDRIRRARASGITVP